MEYKLGNTGQKKLVFGGVNVSIRKKDLPAQKKDFILFYSKVKEKSGSILMKEE